MIDYIRTKQDGLIIYTSTCDRFIIRQTYHCNDREVIIDNHFKGLVSTVTAAKDFIADYNKFN